MPANITRGNASRARVRSRVEHVFASLPPRNAGSGSSSAPLRWDVGIVRARVKIGLANLTHNLTRLAWLSERTVPARDGTARQEKLRTRQSRLLHPPSAEITPSIRHARLKSSLKTRLFEAS
jgi:hypothetical protein